MTAAAFVAAAAGVSGWFLRHAVAPPHGFMDRLVAASRSSTRTVQARLSGGFAWAPLRSATRGEPFRDHRLAAAVAAVRAEIPGDDTAAVHVLGVADLLAGETREALTHLSSIATLNDPAVLSDLSAANFEMARQYDAPELLVNALAACDRALAIEPQLKEALFNRALILERLGVRDDAREAWQRYLVVDGSGGWASEASQHLQSLARRPSFFDLLTRDYSRVAKDPAAAASLVAHDPFGARSAGVVDVLGRWADALSRGDRHDADLHLDVARKIGAAISRSGGDRMLERAVATIDAADGPRRQLLGAGHADYRTGIKTFQDSRPVDAEAVFRRAAEEFEQAHSPMVLPARCFAASAAFEQGRPAEARHEFETLLSTVSPEFPAYQAHVLWRLAMCHVADADWGEAIANLTSGATSFDQLGEMQNAAAMRRLLAFVYERTGDPDSAWKNHVAALQGIGAESSLPLEKAVASIADAAILRHDWRAAASFLTLEISIGRRLRDDLQLASAFFARAVVLDRLHDDGSVSDMVEGRSAASRLKDPAYRSSMRLIEQRASAMLARTPPAEAEAFLTEMIDLHSGQTRLDLPRLLLQRARVRRRAGNARAAKADLQRGIMELERQRESLPAGEARWGAFFSAEELFEDGIDLAVADHDAEEAFRFAERARARALLDTYGRSPFLDYHRLPADTTVVEYVVLPARLVIFTVDARGVGANSIPCTREEVAAEIDTLVHALNASPPVVTVRAATAVYRRLIEPVAPRLLGAATVVFVPDGITATAPFNALTDTRGDYLLERHAIVVAPSAAAFAAAAQHQRRDAHTRQSALIVSAANQAGAREPLLFVERESRSVAQSYARATLVQDSDAEVRELTRDGGDFDVIHFAGHAIGGSSIESAALLVRQNGREQRLGVSEIAKLHLQHDAVVVLAGCNTARGPRRAAEGVISVAYGFLTAGASSVIATLWPIDDEAAAGFFPRLHHKLAQGMPPAEALRAVQLESIHSGDVPAALWAAVQDIGS